MKKVLIITSSLRPHSNSDTLAAAFAQGAQDAGLAVETISLKGKKIQFCTACYACKTTGSCVAADDAPAIIRKMQQADIIAFAGPIYFYEMSGQLKTLLDRTVSIYNAEYRFRDIYTLFTAAEEDSDTDARAFDGICGWVECFERARMAGRIFVGGVYEKDDILEHPVLKSAYRTGMSLAEYSI